MEETKSKTPVIRLGSKTQRPVEIKSEDGTTKFKCQFCGKWIVSEDSIENEAGGYCDHLREQGMDDATLAEMRTARTVDKMPKTNGVDWVKLKSVGRACEKANIPVSRLITAFGGDRGIEPALRPEFQFVYYGRARYVDPWCMTKEGLAFIRAVGNQGSESLKTDKPKKTVKPASAVEEMLAPEA